MKWFLLVAAICLSGLSIKVQAENKALVYEIKPEVVVALAETPCQFPTMKNFKNSKAAVVQNSKGNYVKGCWYITPDKKFYHIDWHNPKVPGDFAELSTDLFKLQEVY